MKRFALQLLLAAIWLFGTTQSNANFLDRLFKSSTSTTNQASTALNSLSQEQVVAALKEALGQGVQHAVSSLGKTNGFMTNLNVRIPMPAQLQTVERTLRNLKQDKLADDFVLTMNRAAEEAVPAASGVLTDALKQMTITDAKNILTGPDNAATEYFNRVSRTNLTTRLLPIVQKATAANKVTSSYKALLEKTGSATTTGGTTNTTNSVTRALGNAIVRGTQQYLNNNAVDVDAYVTEKTLDGLFKMVAEEEKLIRQNPQARGTELLEKVFGVLKK